MVANDVPREEVRCALCGSDNPALLFEVGAKQRNGVYLDGVFHPIARRERIVRCRECGLVYVNPFALHGRSRVKRWLLQASHRLRLQLDNGLGLLARRPN